MCEPTMIIGIGGAVANAAVDLYSQNAEFNAQQEAYQKNKQAADEAAAFSNRQLTLREMQERVAARRSIFQADLEARRAEAIARVEAGESGVSGVSVDMVLSDIERQRLLNQQNTNANFEALQQQLQAERAGIEAQRRSRINALPKAEFNPFATFLNIGRAGMQAYSAVDRNTPKLSE